MTLTAARSEHVTSGDGEMVFVISQFPTSPDFDYCQHSKDPEAQVRRAHLQHGFFGPYRAAKQS